MKFEASPPADGEVFELVEQGEGLLHDVAELAQVLDVRGALAGDYRQDPAFAQFTADGFRVVCLDHLMRRFRSNSSPEFGLVDRSPTSHCQPSANTKRRVPDCGDGA